MLFLSAQDMTTYFLWQAYVCVENLNSKNISKEEIHVLFGTQTDQPLLKEDQIILECIQKKAQIFFYKDNRKEKYYPSSIRSHIIRQHFLQNSHLEKEIIFYHDCDIIFRELPPLLNEVSVDTWYVSDTANYLDSNYIKMKIGEVNFNTMCSIVGINSGSVIKQDLNCGGAQYLMQFVTAAFWEKVEKDSEAIYRFLEKVNKQKHIEEILGKNEFNYLVESRAGVLICGQYFGTLFIFSIR